MKTYLVKETLGDRLDFEFSGMYQVPAKIQIREFQKKLNNRNGKRANTPKDWFEAFDHLQEYLIDLGKPSEAVFLDELPWMDTPAKTEEENRPPDTPVLKKLSTEPSP